MSEETPELPPHWQPGSLIAGRFRVERVLGHGGMGAVVEAENVALGQRVALKVLRKELVQNREAQARFDREARVVSQLVTEHVVRVHDLGRTELDEPFIVMELLAGKTLEDLIDAPPVTPIPDAVDLVCEAAVGLAVAHGAGVVHRDVKPSNLFVTKRSDGSDVVKVLDFGLTKITRADSMRLTSSASVFGTPLYMSPEQIMSSKDVDAPTDQHALAMVLYELLTKAPPYYDDQPTAVTVKIATLPPPRARERRPDVPEGLDRAIRHALAKKPSERFPDVAAFAEAIAPFGTERARAAAERAATALGRGKRPPEAIPTLSPPALLEAASEPPPPPPTRATGALFAALGAGLLLTVGAAALLIRRVDEPAATTAAASSPPPSATPEATPATSATTAATAPSSTTTATASPSASASASPSAPPTALPTAARPLGSPRPTARPATPTAKPTGEFIPSYTPKR